MKFSLRHPLFATFICISFLLHTALFTVDTVQQTSENRSYKGEQILEQIINEANISLLYQEKVSLSYIAIDHITEYDVKQIIIRNPENQVLVKVGDSPNDKEKRIKKVATHKNNIIGSVELTMKSANKAELIQSMWLYVLFSLMIHLIVWLLCEQFVLSKKTVIINRPLPNSNKPQQKAIDNSYSQVSQSNDNDTVVDSEDEETQDTISQPIKAPKQVFYELADYIKQQNDQEISTQEQDQKQDHKQKVQEQEHPHVYHRPQVNHTHHSPEYYKARAKQTVIAKLSHSKDTHEIAENTEIDNCDNKSKQTDIDIVEQTLEQERADQQEITQEQIADQEITEEIDQEITEETNQEIEEETDQEIEEEIDQEIEEETDQEIEEETDQEITEEIEQTTDQEIEETVNQETEQPVISRSQTALEELSQKIKALPKQQFVEDIADDPFVVQQENYLQSINTSQQRQEKDTTAETIVKKVGRSQPDKQKMAYRLKKMSMKLASIKANNPELMPKADKPATPVSIKFEYVDQHNLLHTLAPSFAQSYFRLYEDLLIQAIDQLLADPDLQGVCLHNTPTFTDQGAVVQLYAKNGSQHKLWLASVMLTTLYDLMIQFIYDTHRNTGKFALKVVSGVSLVGQESKMSFFLHQNIDEIYDTLVLCDDTARQELAEQCYLRNSANNEYVYVDGVKTQFLEPLVQICYRILEINKDLNK